ncbi:hypothetical protein F2Q69_00018447 [Brassica cretica]|uniref:Uncharacterized protein n=1 Tax=Brassica cretica TaxID=69181 RepID=A0A8S9QHI2_BRACR|nr:hypothetical protein F2Q69_00018447 [Brassica cretica]
MSVLRFQHTTPSQASTVLHRFFSATLSPELLAYTEVLGIQVKLLYGSLLSLATFIPRYVLVIFVYQFTIEDLSICNELKLFGF